MSFAIQTEVKEPAATPAETAAMEDKVSVKRAEFLLRRHTARCRTSTSICTEQGDGLYRSLRLRQVHAAAHLEPHLRPLPQSARRRRGDARRREHPEPEAGPEPAARQGRHGVPEADAVPDDHLRQHRLRRAPLRSAVRSPSSTPAWRTALRARRCGTRSRTSSTRAVSASPAASSSDCASRAPSPSSRR